ncbi:heme exporter protein CcmB [Zavarzinia compransoris]|uniref:Heme exporter protein B n=1 Tax=Zavarzinia compransoris TaxID=1264899 RepID=A0A317E4S5_9PROT|nr:heme exporter protein CcmB [Zavarzinia compransoris]PWR22067.1 heme exporter protein CcmB [Zavarzinia compransoris]TDP47191.1 heme exporter protein B [Zavarzinia compransoris]
MSAFSALLRRDLRLAFSHGGSVGLVVGFFVIAATLFPLAAGPERQELARVAPAVIWIGALLATLLSLDRLFQADLEDGSLDLLLAGGAPVSLVVLAKCLAHWLSTGLPLVVVSPLLSLLLGLDPPGMAMLGLTLLLGTPTLSLIGAVGAGLTVGVRRAGILIAVLVLPLYVPVLIFGAGAVDLALLGLDTGPSLALLGAILLVSLPVGTLGTAAALRLAVL